MQIYKGAAIVAVSLLGLLATVGTVSSQAAYVTCVQAQLAAMGHSAVKATGKADAASVAAAEAVRAQYAGRKGIALIPRLNDDTAVSWCREIGALGPTYRAHMPSARPPIVLSNGGTGSLQSQMLAQAFAEAERLFRTRFGIEPASRVDIAGAASAQELARLAVELQRQHGPSFGRMDSRVGRVCGSPSTYYGGQAWLEQLLICWPHTADYTAAWRKQAQPRVTDIMVHEYMHHIQNELANFKNVYGRRSGFRGRIGPSWLVEGSAEYASLRWMESRGVRMSLQDLQKTARSVPKPLAAMLENQSLKGRKDYEIARFAAYLLISRFGEKALLDHWRYIGQGLTWEQSFAKAFGMRMQTYQQEFQTYRVDAARAAAFAVGK
ncbi:MAG: hypothetical protein KDK24_21815 [Pseudooceanicola sp.]|nr:hypothetical protein [Pseudooceanicola sp.]